METGGNYRQLLVAPKSFLSQVGWGNPVMQTAKKVNQSEHTVCAFHEERFTGATQHA